MEYAGSDRLDGEIEIDESFLGGKFHNMHIGKRKRLLEGAKNAQGLHRRTKAVVFGMLERPKGITGLSRVRTTVVGHDVQPESYFRRVSATVKRGSRVYTDDDNAFAVLSGRYIRQVINHAHEYVRGRVHTNGIENFWSLLKRCLRGTYVSVEPYHLSAYVDEQCFRFNRRKETDGERFTRAMSMLKGCRLTYDKLTRAEQA
jgi:transposase-like protein